MQNFCLVRVLQFNSEDGDSKVEQMPNSNSIVTVSKQMVAYESNLYDAILFLPQCRTHKKVLLRQLHKKDLHYLPYFPIKLGNSWFNQISFFLNTLLSGKGFNSPVDPSTVKFHLIRLNQIRLPKDGAFLQQFVISVQLKSCGGQCGFNNSKFKWFSTDQVTVNGAQLWGPEPRQYLYRAECLAQCHELSINRDLKASKGKWPLFQSLEYKDKDLACLMTQFLLYCYPSQAMNQVMLTDFIAKMKLDLTMNSKRYTLSRLYRSFCLANGDFITFKSLVLGMVALEPKCPHGNLGGELRARCIFRFYAKETESGLVFGHAELVNLYEDIVAVSKDKEKANENPQLSADNLCKELKLKKKQDHLISQDKFIELLGFLKIRGSAAIFRANKSPLAQIRSMKYYGSALKSRKVKLEQLLHPSRQPQDLAERPKQCGRCSAQNYRLAADSLALNCDTGALLTWYHGSDRTPNKSLERIEQKNSLMELRRVLLLFSHTAYGFPRSAKDYSVAKWQNKEERASLVDKILKVCLEAKLYFRSCPRLIKCTAPTVVFGDIHGNFKDLMVYDYLFWRMTPHGHVCPSLFLGDYVDRGDMSVESVLHLLVMKLLLPDRIHLLRGNHEMRPIQQQFTFYQECLDKFGPSKGTYVWDALNQVFDCLPLCALVNEQIFCAHGGIPTCSTRLEALYEIPMPLPNPLESRCAWEMLWNDPIDPEDYDNFKSPCLQHECFPLHPNGFCANLKRGTAYYYFEESVDTFLEYNNLSAILRAHECIPEGFQFTMEGKVATLFSCSRYCGAKNKAAVALIDANGKMRTVVIETTKQFNIKLK